MKTLKNLIVEHDNDYGFDVKRSTQDKSLPLPNLSIVIPYYETGEVFLQTLHYLYRSIDAVKKENIYWQYEIIVIDDGSSNKKASDCVENELRRELNIISIHTNQGRTKTRNHGLSLVKYEKCLFMDSDVFVAEEFLLYHLRAHAFAKNIYKMIITVGFFQFVDIKDLSNDKNRIHCQDIVLNDFRLSCTYGDTWIGCDGDKQFIGRKFRIVEETDSFRKWPINGFFGPWFLTNMVLGGFFIVDTELSKKVNGFDESFEGYGFTETSLPTKLIAGYENFLVPVIQGGCLHIDDERINVSRKEKDMIFQKKHDFYFNQYLCLTWEQALQGYGKI